MGVIILVALGAAFILGSLMGGGAADFFSSLWPTPTSAPITSRASRPVARPESTQPLCNLWSEVSLEDEGSEMCVYGVVGDVYSNGQGFFIVFTKGSGFHFLSRKFAFPGVTPGTCVMAVGRIERVADAPVIVLDDHTNLFYCQ